VRCCYRGGLCVVFIVMKVYFLPSFFFSVLCIALRSSTVSPLALHTKSPACMVYDDGSNVCGVAVYTYSPYSTPNSLPSSVW
jgi:hypothetical protein